MHAFGVGDAENNNLPFKILSRGRSWRHQNPYCCYIALNRSRRSLSYKKRFTPRSKGLLETGNSSFQIAKPVSMRIR